MELIKLSGLNSCNLNHKRFSDIFSSFSHERTFHSQVLGFPRLPGRHAGKPTWLDWSQSWAHSHQWPNWQKVGSSCRQRAATQKVRTVSPLQVKASNPWCYYPLTHAHRHTHTGAHTHTDSPHYFPWLSCMAGSFLTESRAVCLRKVQLPQLRRSETLPPFTSLPAASSFSSQPFLLFLDLSHTHCLWKVWLTARHVRAGEHTWLTVYFFIWFFSLNLFVVHH